MSNATTAIAVAFVGVLGAIGGAAFAGRREHQKWLREQRLEAYVGLLAAVSKTTNRWWLRRLGAAGEASSSDATRMKAAAGAATADAGDQHTVSPEPGDLDTLKDTEKANLIAELTILEQVQRAEAQVRIVGPVSIDSIASRLASNTSLYLAMLGEKGADTEVAREHARAAVRQASDAFVNTARRLIDTRGRKAVLPSSFFRMRQP